MCGVLHEWFLYLVIGGLSFIDGFSRTTWVYLLKDKSNVFSVFNMFYKIFLSDNGGEYMSGNLEA